MLSDPQIQKRVQNYEILAIGTKFLSFFFVMSRKG